MVRSSDKSQEKYWDSIKDARFDWQTKHPFISAQEQKLLGVLNSLPGKTILEVGCGEGPNLVNIQKKYERCGIDYSKKLIDFSRKKVSGVHFSCQDATNMQFADDTFDVVFCRDLIHHLHDRSKMVSEMFRICKKGGRVVLIESNGCNPLIFLFSCLVPAENDVRYITPAYLRRLLTDKKILSWDYAEPLSLWRLIFHYKYGLPKLATYSIVQRMYVLLEKLLACLIPKKLWGYMIVVMQKDTVSGHK